MTEVRLLLINEISLIDTMEAQRRGKTYINLPVRTMKRAIFMRHTCGDPL